MSGSAARPRQERGLLVVAGCFRRARDVPRCRAQTRAHVVVLRRAGDGLRVGAGGRPADIIRIKRAFFVQESARRRHSSASAVPRIRALRSCDAPSFHEPSLRWACRTTSTMAFFQSGQWRERTDLSAIPPRYHSSRDDGRLVARILATRVMGGGSSASSTASYASRVHRSTAASSATFGFSGSANVMAETGLAPRVVSGPSASVAVCKAIAAQLVASAS